MFVEEKAIWRVPRKGKCPKSPFAIGYHRVGLFEISCRLDGGCSGNSCKEICLHCGKVFKGGWFVSRNQPSKINP